MTWTVEVIDGFPIRWMLTKNDENLGELDLVEICNYILENGKPGDVVVWENGRKATVQDLINSSNHWREVALMSQEVRVI